MYLFGPIDFRSYEKAEKGSSEGTSYFSAGVYNDFNTGWCADIGNEVQIVLWLLSVTYIGEFIALWAIRYVIKSLDQSKWCCPINQPDNTKKKTI